jgi:hypothetical protein
MWKASAPVVVDTDTPGVVQIIGPHSRPLDARGHCSVLVVR